MQKNRREFIFKGAMLSSALALGMLPKNSFAWTKSQPQSNEWLWLVDGLEPDTYKDDITVSQPAHVLGLNPLSNERKKIPISFYGHHIGISADSQTAATSEKWGRRLAILDLKKNSVRQELVTPQSCRYFGHICFSTAGNQIFASAMDDKNKRGIILVYDVLSGKLLRTLSSHGLHPHQIRLLDDQRLMVANAKDRKLSVINTTTGLLLSEQILSSKSPAHFAYEETLDLALMGGRPDPNEKELTTSGQSPDLEFQTGTKAGISKTILVPNGEVLSLEKTAITNKVGKKFLSVVSIPTARHIVVLDMQTQEILFSKKMDSIPKGIAFSQIDPTLFYLTTSEKKLFAVRCAVDQKFDLEFTSLGLLGNGAHLSLCAG